jgi:hypothetical protein
MAKHSVASRRLHDPSPGVVLSASVLTIIVFGQRGLYILNIGAMPMSESYDVRSER